MLDIQKIRSDFPAINQSFDGKPLVYFDNAATTLKPKAVIESVNHHYGLESGNIHRGVHRLSEKATGKYEGAREIIKTFINAKSTKEIIFTSGTTEGINLVASSFGQSFKKGDEVVITHLEHHSNIVPWQLLREQKKIILKVAPITEDGEINIEEFGRLITEKTKLVSFNAISNSLGTINPIEKMIAITRKNSNAKILIDGAQAIAHQKIDVQQLDVDFLVFSAHKIYGPTGVGVLYGKEKVLNEMPPYQGGGDMIASVSFEKTLFNELPHKFEAGTPPIASVIGFGEAIKYFQGLDLSKVIQYEDELRIYAEKSLNEIEGFRIIGTSKNKAAITSFVMKGIHPHDIGTFTANDEIAIRTGHHCTQPVMTFFKVPATARASFSIYNTKEEIDLLKQNLLKTREFFS